MALTDLIVWAMGIEGMCALNVSFAFLKGSPARFKRAVHSNVGPLPKEAHCNSNAGRTEVCAEATELSSMHMSAR